MSLTRGRFCRLQLLLVLANAVILGFEYRGTRDHILLSQTSIFVASCDSQGYSGDIRPRLHTGFPSLANLLYFTNILGVQPDAEFAALPPVQTGANFLKCL
jgi:hypothetical protein